MCSVVVVGRSRYGDVEGKETASRTRQLLGEARGWVAGVAGCCSANSRRPKVGPLG